MNPSIDTLKLWVRDFKVTPTHKLSIQPAYVDCKGETITDTRLFDNVRGTKAIFNNDNVQVTVANIKNGEIGCYVQTSMPKLVHKNNYYSIDASGFNKGLTIIDAELKEIGIKTNLDNSFLSRIDFNRTIELNEPFESYTSILRALKMPRKHTRDYGSTFLHHSRNEELCIYDKIEEMLYHKLPIKAFPANVLRAELRKKTHKSIKDGLKLATVKELKANYDITSSFYQDKLKATIFKFEPNEIEILGSEIITLDSLIQDMNFFKAEFPRSWFWKYLSYFNMKNQVQLQSTGILIPAIKEVSNNRKQAYRLTKQVEKVERDIMFQLKDKTSLRTFKSLYAELKTKLVS